MQRCKSILSIAGVVAICALSTAQADINLEWRPATQAVDLGSTVAVGLYAVSDDDSEQSLSSMDVIVQWDPERLALVGRINDGPYAWLVSSFLANDSLGA